MLYAMLLFLPIAFVEETYGLSWNIFQLIFLINVYYVLQFAVIYPVSTSTLKI
jgi:hypothetical protein